MTSKEKIEAAFSEGGAKEIPAVICYERIFIRDHWEELVGFPWWYQFEPDIEKQMLWRSKVIEQTGQDWFNIPEYYSNNERSRLFLETRGEEVYRIDRVTGTEEKLVKPLIGGWPSQGGSASVSPDKIVNTFEEIDNRIPEPPENDKKISMKERDNLAKQMLKKYGKTLVPLAHTASPLWACYKLWGFNVLMTMVIDRPELVKYACKRYLNRAISRIEQAALMGAEVIWIEESMTDMVSPQIFKDINIPMVKALAEHIRVRGLKSIYYYCGNPEKKLDMILSCGTDAIAFEEGKKNFEIDIDDLADAVKGRCTILGNLDALLLEKGTETELKEEVERQIKAGHKNKRKFIMSVGSPITPGTSVKKVQLYCELAHEIGKL